MIIISLRTTFATFFSYSIASFVQNRKMEKTIYSLHEMVVKLLERDDRVSIETRSEAVSDAGDIVQPGDSPETHMEAGNDLDTYMEKG